MKVDLTNFIKNMPKVELHIHLEGSIPCKSNNNLDFFQKYTIAAKCLKTPDDIKNAIRYIFKDRYKQNILYTEYYYQSNFHIRKMPLLVQLNALNSEINKEYNKYLKLGKKIIVKIIIDFPRTQSYPMPHITQKHIKDIINWQKDNNSDMVVGFGLGGRFETCRGCIDNNPKQKIKDKCEPLTFRSFFKEARNKGYKIIPHAGETSGWKTIQDTIKYLKPHRIGHGIRIMENKDLVKKVAKEQIIIDVCPTSNLMTLDFYLKDGKTSKEYYDSIYDTEQLNYKYSKKNNKVIYGYDERYPFLGKLKHPVLEMLKAGLKVTINSDDPNVFDTTLTDELLLCIKEFNFTLFDIYKVMSNAIDGISDSKYKKYLKDELNSYILKIHKK